MNLFEECKQIADIRLTKSQKKALARTPEEYRDDFFDSIPTKLDENERESVFEKLSTAIEEAVQEVEVNRNDFDGDEDTFIESVLEEIQRIAMEKYSEI